MIREQIDEKIGDVSIQKPVCFLSYSALMALHGETNILNNNIRFRIVNKKMKIDKKGFICATYHGVILIPLGIGEGPVVHSVVPMAEVRFAGKDIDSVII